MNIIFANLLLVLGSYAINQADAFRSPLKLYSTQGREICETQAFWAETSDTMPVLSDTYALLFDCDGVIVETEVNLLYILLFLDLRYISLLEASPQFNFSTDDH
jgi:hypothetical protein